MDMDLGHKLEEAVRACGAFKAECIPAEKIVLSAKFREACKTNSCGHFGRCYQCPPDIGEISELMERVRAYPYAVLYQSVAQIEDSFDYEGMMDAAQAHVQLSQRVQKKVKTMLPEGFLHLSNGCSLCKRCAKEDNLPCRHPLEALPSMSGFGVDVYNTAAGTDLHYINGQNTVTYFGMVLFVE